MLGVVMAVEESRVQTIEVCFGGKLYGISKQLEVKVGIAVHLQLSCVFARQPCFCRGIIMESLSFGLYELSSYAEVVFVVGIGAAVKCRHGEMPQL